MKEWVEGIRVADKTDTDHQPVEVMIRGGGREREKQKGTKNFGKEYGIKKGEREV